MKPLLAPVLALFAACAPIRYSSQEAVLRHRAESDTLEVLILYDGIQAEAMRSSKDFPSTLTAREDLIRLFRGE